MYVKRSRYDFSAGPQLVIKRNSLANRKKYKQGNLVCEIFITEKNKKIIINKSAYATQIAENECFPFTVK